MNVKPGSGRVARIFRRVSNTDGQALVLLAGGLVIFLGFVAMSIDVGRYVWARTQMQAAVDAAALAAAQSMPNKVDAEQKATEYWNDNASFILAQGTNVQFTVDFPAQSNKGIVVRGDADVPTWFAKFFGVSKWHVWAEGEAESQVLDISIVLDISGSMCYESYPDYEKPGVQPTMSPGRASPSGGSFPYLISDIPAGGSDTIVITLNDISIFKSTSSSANNTNFGRNSSTPYWQDNLGITGVRTGMIMISNTAGQREFFQITAVGPSSSPSLAANQMQVTRGMPATPGGPASTKVAHQGGSGQWYAEVWANRRGCQVAAKFGTNGPFEPYDGMVDAAEYFTTLFNSNYDKLGVVSYSAAGSLRQGLTDNFSAVRSSINGMGVPAGGTNIAHGIAVGRQVLDGSGKRSNAVRVMVVLTDGVARDYCGSSTYQPSAYNGTSCSQGNGTVAANHAIQEAQRAASGDILIFTIGLGYSVDHGFLQQVAEIGSGSYYFAPSTAQLDDAFKAIAEQTHIALVR